MSGNLFQKALVFRASIFLLATGILAGCGTVVNPWLPETIVTPLAGEDLATSCKYALRPAEGPTLVRGQAPAPITQTGVLVIYERGDSADLFSDPTVIATAQQQHMAEMFAYQCDALSYNDMQQDATKGQGRALFTALSQLATLTGHPELTNDNLILSGFSVGGYLSMSMADAYPSRILGAILYSPASAYADLDSMPVTPAAAQIPMLITANAQDMDAGSQKPEDLFLRGWQQGAPWAFAVQNGTGHCCSDSVAPLMNPWIAGVMQNQTVPSAVGTAVLQEHLSPVTPNVRFQCEPDGVVDVFYDNVCSFASASILPSLSGGPTPAWLPDNATAQAWVTWVTNPGTN